MNLAQRIRIAAQAANTERRETDPGQSRQAEPHGRDRLRKGPSKATILLTSDPLDRERLVPRPNFAGISLLARMLAPSLDRQLASGLAPESNRLLAARAEMLVAPRTCSELVQNWQHLLDQTHRPPVMRSPRVRLCRDRIIAAEDDIREMLSELGASRPVPSRGIAMAGRLLRDGAGPLYNRHCATDLHAALRDIRVHLDPTAWLAECA
jgi:hypothetical protein